MCDPFAIVTLFLPSGPTPDFTRPSPEHIAHCRVDYDALDGRCDCHVDEGQEGEEVGGGEALVHCGSPRRVVRVRP